ncbi:DUF1559 domain-containing protein [Schlesneria paludicola]|uniref:DUF1559 domain-containing protein n=1 Tax=Schlesneria paludicola TaxID=360056 RepID=UPI000299F75F|nr:DUF1559 domain-containing protein [Schlesneria paludicola]
MTQHSRRGFTIVELLVAVSLITLLVGLFLPAIQRSREAARGLQCRNNLKQLGLALHNYHEVHSRLPPAVIWSGRGEPYGAGSFPVGAFDRVAQGISPNSEPDRIYSNWAVSLLPHIDQVNLYNSFDLNLPMDDVTNLSARTTRLSAMLCPSDSFNATPYERALNVGVLGHTYARGNYGMNVGGNQCFAANPRCVNGFQTDSNDFLNTCATVFGSGCGGVNYSFRLRDFTSGLSTFVAIDELRAGISAIDPRGTWSLGMAGASATLINRKGPNTKLLGDGIDSCTALTLQFSQTELDRIGMPCDHSIIPVNWIASARSMHGGFVNALFLDGSVHALADSIDTNTWIQLHDRNHQ